jgi:hypothetical protein
MAVRSRVVDRAAGILLLAGAFANFGGVIMFSIRGGPSEMAEELFPSWGSGAASLAFLGIERGLFMAAMVLSALGFCLLDGRRYRPGAYVFMRLGVTAYLAASIIGVVAETLEVASRPVYPMFVVYVTLAFVSQTAIGCALAMSELIPRWIGWATAIWNLAWLAILVLARPWDIYFPILHLVRPGFIGAVLILRRGRKSAPEADLADIQRRRVVSNLVESTHSAHPARMAPLTSGSSGLSVDSIAASLKPAASTNASTCVLS